MWHRLPTDVVLLILQWRTRLAGREARRVQCAWRGYRVRVLLGRFRMLRYLREFREWNPSVSVFLQRATL
jgi:hypothetical protein